MKRPFCAITIALSVGLVGGALAQAPQEHQQHHPGGAPATQSAPLPTPQPTQPPAQTKGPMSQMPMGQMMQGMPEQCRGMMENMQSCMGMMQQMMQGRMGQGGMGHGGMPGHAEHGSSAMPGAPAPSAARSTATTAYMEAADKMHAPMMEGIQVRDPDEAYVRGMIAHHQGAVAMAQVRLQYGKDEQTRKWAEDVIRDQQREIDEMQAWLRKNVR